MKTITLVIRQAEINKHFPHGLRLQVEEEAAVLDAIKAADRLIEEKCGKFPVAGFKCLLKMVYHPQENRFYNQVAIQAYTKSYLFLNVRENPRMSLPNETTVIIVPEGGCATDWEQPVR